MMTPSSYAITDRCIDCNEQACIAACPTGSIRLYPLASGAFRAAIGPKCIADGRCVGVCPVNAPVAVFSKRSLNNALVLRAKEENERLVASGGAMPPKRPREADRTRDYVDATVVRNERVGESMHRLVLRTERPLTKFPAAYAVLAGLAKPGSPIRRGKCYSFAGLDPVEHEFLVTRSGRFGEFLCAQSVGTTLGMSPPSGGVDLLQLPAGTNLVILASGSGVSPAVSLLRAAADHPSVARTVLVHVARTRSELAFHDEISRLVRDSGDRIDYLPFTTSGLPGDGVALGRPTSTIEVLMDSVTNARWHAFGSYGFVHEALRMAEQKGIPIGLEDADGRFDAVVTGHGFRTSSAATIKDSR